MSTESTLRAVAKRYGPYVKKQSGTQDSAKRALREMLDDVRLAGARASANRALLPEDTMTHSYEKEYDNLLPLYLPKPQVLALTDALEAVDQAQKALDTAPVKERKTRKENLAKAHDDFAHAAKVVSEFSVSRALTYGTSLREIERSRGSFEAQQAESREALAAHKAKLAAANA